MEKWFRAASSFGVPMFQTGLFFALSGNLILLDSILGQQCCAGAAGPAAGGQWVN